VGPLFDLGRWDELVSVADEVIEWSEAAGSGYDEITARLWETQVLILRGQVPQATSITDLMTPAREIGDPQVLVPAVVVSGLIALDEGRAEEAIRLVEELDRAPDIGLGWYREHFVGDLVRLCVAAGDNPMASKLIEQAEAFTTRHRLSLASARAALQEAFGMLEEASALYEEAIPGWTEYGHVVETGRALLGAGRCRLRMRHQDARPQLLRAREIFTDLGASVLLAEADACLAEAPT
jgi:tetratricopeptide (TPR) repeat protein